MKAESDGEALFLQSGGKQTLPKWIDTSCRGFLARALVLLVFLDMT